MPSKKSNPIILIKLQLTYDHGADLQEKASDQTQWHHQKVNDRTPWIRPNWESRQEGKQSCDVFLFKPRSCSSKFSNSIASGPFSDSSKGQKSKRESEISMNYSRGNNCGQREKSRQRPLDLSREKHINMALWFTDIFATCDEVLGDFVCVSLKTGWPTTITLFSIFFALDCWRLHYITYLHCTELYQWHFCCCGVVTFIEEEIILSSGIRRGDTPPSRWLAASCDRSLGLPWHCNMLSDDSQVRIGFAIIVVLVT